MPARPAALRKIVNPYVEFVSENATCQYTGLRLQDILAVLPTHVGPISTRVLPGGPCRFWCETVPRVAIPSSGSVPSGAPLSKSVNVTRGLAGSPREFCEHVARRKSLCRTRSVARSTP